MLCAKVNTWEVDAKRVWDGASPEVQDIMVGAIDQYYRDRPQTQRDEVMRSAGIFAQTLMLLAQEHGLDSCQWTVLTLMQWQSSLTYLKITWCV